MRGAKITAIGTYTPPGRLTNQDLEKIVETTDEWILGRTGICNRFIAAPDVATSDLATAAAKQLLERYQVDPLSIDAILLCTVTPDMLFPSTACLVQNNIGARKAWGFDLVAACSGFVYGLTTAAHLVMAGTHKRVMVIGADTMARISDYTDRATCVLFGDGAGAVLVEPTEEGEEGGFIGHLNEIDGSGGDHLKMPAGGSRKPSSHETVEAREHYVHQEGQQVFKYAVRKMEDMCTGILSRHGVSASDVLLIPHQANLRIIRATAEKLGIDTSRVVINIDKYGNTTAATIPLALADALADGRLKRGNLVLFAAVGAGFTSGSNLWRWTM
ncbi:MAG: ketoacyl-ACP synthase III [Bryobacterales bacterium]|nr:ketoacyl-ACP synthase III [Bryobacterales bacterium]